MGLAAGGLLILPILERWVSSKSWFALGVWVAFASAVSTSIWLSHRFQLVGRSPMAFGMMLMVIGLITAVTLIDYNLSITIGYAIAGFAVGLLFPWAFWRALDRLSPDAKLAIAVTAGIGFAVAWLALKDLSELGMIFWVYGVALLAPLVGLPAAFISPIVQQRDGSTGPLRPSKAFGGILVVIVLIGVTYAVAVFLANLVGWFRYR